MRPWHVRYLRAVGRFSCERPRLVLGLALAITVLSWSPVLFSGVDQAFNVARLLPQDVPAARDFTRVVTDFGSTDEGVVVIRLGGRDDRDDPGDTPEERAAKRAARRALVVDARGNPGPAGAFADALASRLKALGEPSFRDVYCRTFSDEDRDYLRYDALADGGLLLLPESSLDAVERALTPENIRSNVRAFARTRRTLGANHALTLASVQFDSLGLREPIKAAVRQYRAGADDARDGDALKETEKTVEPLTGGAGHEDEVVRDVDEDGYERDVEDAPADDGLSLMAVDGPGYLVDKEARLLLVVYQPTQPAQKVEYAHAVMEAVRREAEAEFSRLPGDAQRRLQLEHTGGYEMAILHEANIYRTLRDTFVSTLVGVLILFGVAFRRPGVFVYVGVPLAMVVSWTVGLGFLIFGRLNAISCAFAAVLVSLGVDYAVHIYNRYVEERGGGAGVTAAFETALAHTGWGVVIGMVTTALAFLSLLWTRFSQLTEFGLLIGLGLAMAVPVMFFVLPALIALRNGKRPEPVRAGRPVMFGLPWVARTVGRHPRVWCGVGGVLGMASLASVIFLGDRMRFDERIDPLRPPMRALDVATEVGAAFSNRSGGSLMVVAYSDTEGRAGEEEALNRAARQRDACRAMMRESVDGRAALVDYESLLTFLPPPETQRRTLARLARIDWDAAITAFSEEFSRAMPGVHFGRMPDGTVAEALTKDWASLGAGFASERAAAMDAAGGDEAARRAASEGLARMQREWMAYTFPLKLLIRHQALAKAGEPLLVSDFAKTPVGRFVARLAATRKREVDFREPWPADLRPPFVLAAAAEARDGTEVAAAGTRYETLESLRALGGEPTDERVEWVTRQVRRVVLACPGWAIKTKLYPPVDPTTRAGDPLLGTKWVSYARERLDAPLPMPGEADRDRLAVLTGIPLLAHELAEIVKADFEWLSVAVLGGAVLALGLFFRRYPVRIVTSLLPIVLGMGVLFGFMALAGIRVNFVNVLVIPILIGLGVDAGIHMVERYFESGRRLAPTIVDTGRAIVITGLTSMIGFGSLWFGAYGGAAGMGMLMIVGLAVSMFVTLFVLPAVLAVGCPAPEAEEEVGG